MNKCIFCGADINESIEYNMKCIESCTNCLTDLKLNGNWTGIGLNIMKSLINTYGIDEVKLTYEKVKLMQL